jgi:hypothetical protein
VKSTFDFMKQFSMFATLAPASGWLSSVSLGLMPAAVFLLVLIAISAPVVCRGEHAKPTGTQEREITDGEAKGGR